jgi:tRNA(Ser,Leu) C12 N-acetylase TAN1
MHDWNTVATNQEGRYHQAIRFLEAFAEVSKTDYDNVLVLRANDIDRLLDEFLFDRLAEQGATARLDFADPDFVIAVETVGQRCGMSLWSRTQRLRYPFLKLD